MRTKRRVRRDDPALLDRAYRPVDLAFRDDPSGTGPRTLGGIVGVVNQAATIRERVRGKLITFTETIAPGAFREAISSRQDTLALINHDANRILGRVGNGTLRLRETASGDLEFEVDPPDTSYARDLQVSIARGDMGGASIGFLPAPDGYRWSDDRKSVLITKIATLFDISVVSRPAYRGTSVGFRSYAGVIAAPVESGDPDPSSRRPGRCAQLAWCRLRALDSRLRRS